MSDSRNNASQFDEKDILTKIKMQVYKNNMDNVSRTAAYLQYYQRYPEITWAFLAHMVSRNAGWNMCDLKTEWYSNLLTKGKRNRLFNTYERANWLIFEDAYPQLLLYHYSTKMNVPMFHLLRYFHVSKFMEHEWERFWHTFDQERLMISQIINEQNVIQAPVIKHPEYSRNVFHSLLFYVQERLHLSYVLFPTLEGEVYGESVFGFNHVDNRILLGKKLAYLLFHPKLYMKFYAFAVNTAHTGSRFDYEQYFSNKTLDCSFELREIYPPVSHHIHEHHDWFTKNKIKNKWMKQKNIKVRTISITNWYRRKRLNFKKVYELKQIFFRGKK